MVDDRWYRLMEKQTAPENEGMEIHMPLTALFAVARSFSH